MCSTSASDRRVIETVHAAGPLSINVLISDEQDSMDSASMGLLLSAEVTWYARADCQKRYFSPNWMRRGAMEV
jgi:hypothetical protein